MAESGRPAVIWTCFAGRHRCLQVQLRYVMYLMERGLVSECHLWNYTRAPEDEAWLKTLYDAKRRAPRRARPNIQLMEVRNKASWREYYQHYTTERYPNHIIIKCDDDIVYMDVDRFAAFIEHRRALPNHLLLFPSIVNNGVCAFYQQMTGLLPADKVGVLPFETTYGRLWSDGALAQLVHMHFIEHEAEWRSKTASLTVREVPFANRISINFFAILSKDLGIFQRVIDDDEAELSVQMPLAFGRPHAIDQSFVVSHLSFYSQRSSGLDEAPLIKAYHRLAHDRGVPPFSA